MFCFKYLFLKHCYLISFNEIKMDELLINCFNLNCFFVKVGSIITKALLSNVNFTLAFRHHSWVLLLAGKSTTTKCSLSISTLILHRGTTRNIVSSIIQKTNDTFLAQKKLNYSFSIMLVHFLVIFRQEVFIFSNFLLNTKSLVTSHISV